MNSATDLSLSSLLSLTKTTTLLASLLATAALLTGCGDSVLDFRNAEISNGKIYKAGADAGFTGTVTNLPADQLFHSHLGMTRLVKTVMAVAGGDAALDLVQKASALCDVKLKKGVLEGAATCRGAKDVGLRFQAKFEDGALHGPFTWYAHSAGDHVIATAGFNHGVLDGTEEIFSPQTRQRVNRLRWREGKVEGEEEVWHPETGKQIGLFHYKDDKLEGEAKRWSPNGQVVTYRLDTANGVQEGLEEEFFPDTGKPLRSTQWSQGKKNGRLQEWDAQGQLIRDAVYQDDRVVSKVALTPADFVQQRCVDRWAGAYRRDHGADVDTAPHKPLWEEKCVLRMEAS